MAPAFVLGQLCDVVDLDGPTFLAHDRTPAVRYARGRSGATTRSGAARPRARREPRGHDALGLTAAGSPGVHVVSAPAAARICLQGGRHRRRLRDRTRTRRILPAERTLGRHRRDAARDADLERGLRDDVPVRARERRTRLPDFLPRAARPRLDRFEVAVSCFRGADACGVRRGRRRHRRCDVRPPEDRRHARAHDRHRAGFAMFGNASVERLFKYVSFLLYGVYVLFVVFAFTHFGDRIIAAFATAAPRQGWVAGGLTYASYNIIGAVVILPVVRHLSQRPRRGDRRPRRRAARDAAGASCSSSAWSPSIRQIANETLPSDFCCSGSICRCSTCFPGHDFRGAARKRHRRRACDQRAHRPRVAESPRGPSSGACRASDRARAARLLHAARRPLRARRADRQRLSAFAYIFLLVYVLPLLHLGSSRFVRRKRGADRRLHETP